MSLDTLFQFYANVHDVYGNSAIEDAGAILYRDPDDVLQFCERENNPERCNRIKYVFQENLKAIVAADKNEELGVFDGKINEKEKLHILSVVREASEKEISDWDAVMDTEYPEVTAPSGNHGRGWLDLLGL